MPQATFDPARILDLFARVARDGSIVIDFIDSNSLPFDISIYEFEFFVKEKDQSTNKKIDLTETSGITKSTSSLQIDLTEAVTSIRESVYYYELLNLTLNKTWLCGNFTLHNGKFDGVNSTNSLIIYDNGENITIQINEVGLTTNSVYTVTTTGTLTPDVLIYDSFEITAQEESLLIANPTGDIGNFEKRYFRVKDDGTSQDITYGDKYVGFGSALPDSTIAGKEIVYEVTYNSTRDIYEVKVFEEF